MRRAAAGVAALWTLTSALWLLAVTGHGAPPAVARGAIVLTVLGSLGIAAVWAGRAVRRAAADRDPAHLAAPVLLALALAVRLVGLDHEVGELFYLDEGSYSHHAARINSGELLQTDFVYPHLLYYLDALAIWMGTLFREAVSRAAEAVYGLEDWQAVRRLLMRLVVALMGAATVLPVLAVGRRLAGTAAGVVAGLLIVFSAPYNDGSHLAICDVPSAFFAALCLAAAARLLGSEDRRWYLLAGAAAGLAAAAKYPAGLVAVAPAAAWLRWRLRDRRFHPGLLQAALAALALFLAANPGLVAYPERALFGSRGVLFGLFLYAGEGWLGVAPFNVPLYYLRHLVWGFGWPALAVGVAGWAALPREGRRHLAWLAPFPVLFLVLVSTATIAVGRTLYPVLPPLAAFLGAGATAAALALARRLPRLGRPAAALLMLAVLALPVVRTVLQGIGLARPGTRVVAREWIREHVPPGVTILREDYTPDLPGAEYDDEGLGGTRFLGAVPLAEALRPETDFVLLSSGAFGRFFAGEALTPEDRVIRERYRTLFETQPLVATFAPGPVRQGPEIRLYRVAPETVAWRTRRRVRAAELFVPDGGMRGGPGGGVRFTAPGQWVLAKGHFEPGAYRLEVAGDLAGPGGVAVRGLARGRGARVRLDRAGAAFELPVRDKYLLYVSLPVGSRVRALEVARQGSAAGKGRTLGAPP